MPSIFNDLFLCNCIGTIEYDFNYMTTYFGRMLQLSLHLIIRINYYFEIELFVDVRTTQVALIICN